MSEISILEFEKAYLSLKEAVNAFENEKSQKTKILFRDATIQRFEFTIELAWKISMKVLGHNVTSPKAAIREMARSALISDTQPWFDAIEARNKSSHSYDEDIAIEILYIINKFLPHADQLLAALKK